MRDQVDRVGVLLRVARMVARLTLSIRAKVRWETCSVDAAVMRASL